MRPPGDGPRRPGEGNMGLEGRPFHAGSLKADFGVSSVAEWFVTGSAAAAQRYVGFMRKWMAVRIQNLDIRVAADHVGAVF